MGRKFSKDDVETYKKKLRKLLRPGATVYTVLRHVSSSGMTRRIDVYVIRKNEPVYLTYRVAAVCGYSYPDKGPGLSVNGCGMDMGFNVVYNLSRVLYPKGFKLHKSQTGRNGDTSGRDMDGGYALNQRWL